MASPATTVTIVDNVTLINLQNKRVFTTKHLKDTMFKPFAAPQSSVTQKERLQTVLLLTYFAEPFNRPSA